MSRTGTRPDLAFIVAGASLIFSARSFLTKNVGIALIATGICSFLYHASASRALRSWDVAAMYWLFLASMPLVLVVLIPSLFPFLKRRGTAWLLGLATPLAGIFVMTVRDFRIFDINMLSIGHVMADFAALTILALAAICFREKRLRVTVTAAACLGIFLLAVLFRRLDEPGRLLYDPDLPIQGHALWHILSATAFYLTITFLDRHSTSFLLLGHLAAKPVEKLG